MDYHWNEQPITISPHAQVRWIERVAELDTSQIRKLMKAIGLSSRSDAALIRLLEKGFRVDMESARQHIISMIHDGKAFYRGGHADVVMTSGHQICIVRDNGGIWRVSTILPPEEGGGRRYSRWGANYQTPSPDNVQFTSRQKDV